MQFSEFLSPMDEEAASVPPQLSPMEMPDPPPPSPVVPTEEASVTPTASEAQANNMEDPVSYEQLLGNVRAQILPCDIDSVNRRAR